MTGFCFLYLLINLFFFKKQNRQKLIELQRDLIGVDNLSIQHDRVNNSNLKLFLFFK